MWSQRIESYVDLISILFSINHRFKKKKITKIIVQIKSKAIKKWEVVQLFFFWYLFDMIFISTSWEEDCCTAKLCNQSEKSMICQLFGSNPFVLSFSQCFYHFSREGKKNWIPFYYFTISYWLIIFCLQLRVQALNMSSVTLFSLYGKYLSQNF